MEEEKLFVYGSLCPGAPNDHILAEIGGGWQQGYILATLVEEGWGAQLGYPGIRLSDSGEKIDGFIFKSGNLKNHWKKLDEFEGEEYTRIKADVHIEHGVEEAWIYALK